MNLLPPQFLKQQILDPRHLSLGKEVRKQHFLNNLQNKGNPLPENLNFYKKFTDFDGNIYSKDQVIELSKKTKGKNIDLVFLK